MAKAKINSSCDPSDIVAQLWSPGKAVHILYHWTISPAKFYLEKLIHSHGSRSIKNSKIKHIPIRPVSMQTKTHKGSSALTTHVLSWAQESLPSCNEGFSSFSSKRSLLCATRDSIFYHLASLDNFTVFFFFGTGSQVALDDHTSTTEWGSELLPLPL